MSIARGIVMARKLEPGDVIWANRLAKGLPYNHCGIYAGDGKVIHFAAPAGAEISMESAVIHETTLERFQDGCPLKVIDFPGGKEGEKIFSAEETVERARSRLGEKGYNFVTNNCDHFALWCKIGKHRSLQAERVKDTIRASGNEVGGIICTLHDVIETFMAPEICFESAPRRADMAKQVDIDLCGQAVSVLANAGNVGSAKLLVSAAISSCGFTVHQPGWPTKRGESFWRPLAEDNGWLIQQHKATKHIRLVSPESDNSKCLASIMLEDKVSGFLSALVEAGKRQGFHEPEMAMPLYQVVTDGSASTKSGCIRLEFAEAGVKFPATKELSAGFYTVHPCNPAALAPVENYFTNLALEKEDEFIVLLGKMGAKSVHGLRCDGKSTSFGLDGGGSAHGGVKDFTVTAGLSVGRELKNFKEYEVHFEGSKPNITADLLRQSLWFKNDSQMNGILESRLSGNPLVSKTFKSDISKSFNFNVKAAAQVLGVGEASLKSSFESIKTSYTEFHVEF
jgi:hypothetical protein